MSKGGERYEHDPDFEALLDYIHRSRGFDFTGYKRPSLMRRITRRMETAGVEGFANYVDYMEVHPDEFAALFDTILINVTDFFRDPAAWELLAAEVGPRILARKPPQDPIRVWSAGCASGQEAYTLAIVLAEALGFEAFRERVKIYATDVDEEALAKARHAVYDAKEFEGMPAELLDKYFEPANHRRAFHKELRRSVIFGRHDLIQDAPISRIDLLACRNTLMYFNSEAQSRIIDRFHFALNDGGLLLLGKSETLLTYSSAFVPIDQKRRLFTKVARGGARERLIGIARAGAGVEENLNHLVSHVRLREAAFEASVTAQLLVDFSGLLVLANERARALFGLNPADLGRPLQDLQLSYRPADLRSSLDRAYADRRPVVLTEVEWLANGGTLRYFDIHVAPLIDAGGALMGAGVTFVDVTANRRLQAELLGSNRELATAYEELQSANEELETTNEELQSTNEELETTNEELQSANEELETMNEELQSTNEEVETMNAELRERSDAARQGSVFLESILGSLPDGVAVVDRALLVQIWNSRAEDLWGLRSDEVRGQHLLNLDIGLPVEPLKQPVRACLSGEAAAALTLDATNRRGRPIRCRVSFSPMRSDGQTEGVILLMEEGDDGRPPAPAGDGESGSQAP